MEQVIVEHFDEIIDLKRFNLNFDLEIPFLQKDNEILIFDQIVFEKRGDEDETIFEGIYRNGEEEGSEDYAKGGLWISWWGNGQKREDEYYRFSGSEGRNGELYSIE